jgi:uncharacterized membrane protein YoaK (UPF0700 family)
VLSAIAGAVDVISFVRLKLFTAHITAAVLALLDEMFSNQSVPVGAVSAKQRLRKTLNALVGFFAGCLAGPAAVRWLGNWVWLLPLVLAGAVMAWTPRDPLKMGVKPRLA